jgi:ubiquinone/menaquinone biosynthesis C-methylase UbiE
LSLILAISLFSGSCQSARPERSEVDELGSVLELNERSTVADVGAGSGEVGITLATRLLPQGRLYSTEVDSGLISKIRSNVIKARPKNVFVVVGTLKDTGLPANCCDAVFLREVYHHLSEPIAMDRALYRAVRPGGRLAIIDFEPTPLAGPRPSAVPANRGGHGVPKRLVIDELTAAGFKLTKTVNWPISREIEHFCMVFAKPD